MSHLERILAAKREAHADRVSRQPLTDVRARAADAAPTKGFLRALQAGREEESIALIAEVKRASPSKGVIRSDFDPEAIARAYRSAGAHCLSVLTDVEFFQGAPEYLPLCRQAAGLPTLRKDFTIDVYDVYEARVLGADAVLLIVHGLSASQLREYREVAESLGMDALVEAHTLEEAELAVSTGASLIGVNNRDLESFETRIDIGEEVTPRIASKAFVVSESALETSQDVARVQKAGAGAVLIGTAFCRSLDVEGKVREVMGW